MLLPRGMGRRTVDRDLWCAVSLYMYIRLGHSLGKFICSSEPDDNVPNWVLTVVNLAGSEEPHMVPIDLAICASYRMLTPRLQKLGSWVAPSKKEN